MTGLKLCLDFDDISTNLDQLSFILALLLFLTSSTDSYIYQNLTSYDMSINPLLHNSAF